MNRRRALAAIGAATVSVTFTGCRGLSTTATPSPTPYGRTCPGPWGECRYTAVAVGSEPIVTGSLDTGSPEIGEDRGQFATLFTDSGDTDRFANFTFDGKEREYVGFVEGTDFSSAEMLVLQEGTEPSSQPIVLERVTAPEPDRLHATVYRPPTNGGEGPSEVPTVLARVPVAGRRPSRLTVDIKAPYGPGPDREIAVIHTFSMAETDPYHPSDRQVFAPVRTGTGRFRGGGTGRGHEADRRSTGGDVRTPRYSRLQRFLLVLGRDG